MFYYLITYTTEQFPTDVVKCRQEFNPMDRIVGVKSYKRVSPFVGMLHAIFGSGQFWELPVREEASN